MDWIKNNYEKLLLGVFGTFALGVGGYLAISAFTGSEDSGASKVTEKSNLGTDKTEDVVKTMAELAASNDRVVWSSVKLGDHRSARLFTASPVMEKAGMTDSIIPILDDATAALRDGVPNWWLYENGLDLTRSDVLTQDFDNDKFNNKEEFEGKSNPRDPESRPAFYAKLSLVEVIPINYEIRFSNVIGNDIQVKRLSPLTAAGVAPGKLDYKIGDTLFDDDKRFKISKIEERETTVGGQKQMVKHLILEDSLNPTKPVVIAEKSTVNLPKYKVKVKSALSGAEDTKGEGEELVFPDFPGIRMNIEKILPGNPETKDGGGVQIDFSEPGNPKGKFQLQLSK